jgi:hypothetical protein
MANMLTATLLQFEHRAKGHQSLIPQRDAEEIRQDEVLALGLAVL